MREFRYHSVGAQEQCADAMTAKSQEAMEVTNPDTRDAQAMAAYVGPPAQFDFMGATQFRLLCTLGLRAHQHLLDVGCGSLRAGRLLISYLDEERYFGIEPNTWLVDTAIDTQIGKDMVRIKKPRFDHNSEFQTDVFSQLFDFIVAQSIFSHAGSDLIRLALGNFKTSLKPGGLIAATFIEGPKDFHGTGWVYPGCVTYRRSTIRRLAEDVGLRIARIPWYHPRQTWYLLAVDKDRLPHHAMLRYLAGAVLSDPEFADSWSRREKIKRSLKQRLPSPVKQRLKKLIGPRHGGP